MRRSGSPGPPLPRDHTGPSRSDSERHGAELEHAEVGGVPGHPVLHVEDRSGDESLTPIAMSSISGAEQYQRRRAEQQVLGPLQHAIHAQSSASR